MDNEEIYKEIASTILVQLGGNKFIMATGSRNIKYIENGLKMSLVANKSGANTLEIILDLGTDLYKMVFSKVTRPTLRNNYSIKTKIVKEYDGVYFDMLQDIFTGETGLVIKI